MTSRRSSISAVPTVEADTVGGLVYELLGAIPKVGAGPSSWETRPSPSSRSGARGSNPYASPARVPLVRDRTVRAIDHEGQQEARDTQEESPAHARHQ